MKSTPQNLMRKNLTHLHQECTKERKTQDMQIPSQVNNIRIMIEQKQLRDNFEEKK